MKERLLKIRRKEQREREGKRKRKRLHSSLLMNIKQCKIRYWTLCEHVINIHY